MEYAVNIEMLYPGIPFSDRIRRVKETGFEAIEFWGWHDKDIDDIVRICQENDVRVKAISATGGHSPCDREHQAECICWVEQTMKAAEKLGAKYIIMFPNHFTKEGCADFRNKYTKADGITAITSLLMRLVPELEAAGITLLLEPLNNHGTDHGMSVTDTEEGAAIVRAVNSEHVRLLLDVFHMQLMHGNLWEHIRENLDIVPYIHLADVPGRHEAGTGEINFRYLLQMLKEKGYEGTICPEYFPQGDTDDSLYTWKQLFACNDQGCSS